MVPDNSENQLYRYPIPDDVAPSRATYLAVAEATGCDPLELPPLAKTIDTDALDGLGGTPTESEDFTVTFEYASRTVTVTAEEVHVDGH